MRIARTRTCYARPYENANLRPRRPPLRPPLHRRQCRGLRGRYTSNQNGYRQEADIKAAANGGYAVDVYVGVEGCSGAFEGAGTIEGANLVAHLNEEGEACRLTISRTASGIKIDEDGCFNWHGPSCGFDGTLRKRK